MYMVFMIMDVLYNVVYVVMFIFACILLFMWRVFVLCGYIYIVQILLIYYCGCGYVYDIADVVMCIASVSCCVSYRIQFEKKKHTGLVAITQDDIGFLCHLEEKKLEREIQRQQEELVWMEVLLM